MASSDRRPYLSATTLDQALLDQMQDNLEFGLELVVDIQTPTGYIRASDRNKYVGSVFYEALLTFPIIKRTLGEWLNPGLEFSTLELALSNVDSRLNNFLPGGADFSGWIGKTLDVRLGLRDVSSTYFSIYKGTITDVGGFRRDTEKITLIGRDKFDTVNVEYPKTALTTLSFPNLEDSKVGTILPYIYGDWTEDLSAGGASVPAFVVNGADVPANVDVIDGNENLVLYISENANRSFDTSNVYVLRDDVFYQFDAADITGVLDNRAFELKQTGSGGVTVVDGSGYIYDASDQFFVRVEGKDLGSRHNNAVWIARDILMTHGGLVSGDFAANWATLADKASPAESNIAGFKCRSWRQEPESALTDALQLLEQVRIEMAVDNAQKFRLYSLHLDDFPSLASIDYELKNWDIQKESFSPKLDDRNIWNRAKAEYRFDPFLNANSQTTPTYRNQGAITQAGKEISKKVIFPNLHKKADVILQLKEMLKMASGYSEFIDAVLTPRSVKKELGDFVKINVTIGSTQFTDVPAMIREIGYDPNGLRVPVKLWSFQMLPYPAYSPSYSGIVGGSTATITEE